MNPRDPGIGLLAEAVRGRDPRSIVLVCTGAVPGAEGALRFVLDVREQKDAHGPTRPWTLDEDAPDTGPRRPSFALVWPRAHLGKDFAAQCLARGGLEIAEGGTVLCAVRKQKGAESLAELMGRLFGNVRTEARARGYRLLASTRGPDFDREHARVCLRIRYRIEDPALEGIALASAPGVFSRQYLDDGTRCLLTHARTRVGTPRAILDLCTGVGPLAIWAARRVHEAQVLAIDSNVLAVALARHNAAANGVGERVTVLAHDGLPPHDPGPCELALVNPPTHADLDALAALLLPLRTWLHRGAPAWIVANRPERIAKLLASAGARIELHPHAGYTVLDARW